LEHKWRLWLQAPKDDCQMFGFIKRVKARIAATEKARRGGYVPWVPDPRHRALLREGSMPSQLQIQFLADYTPAGWQQTADKPRRE
jgi:hypothetical protein